MAIFKLLDDNNQILYQMEEKISSFCFMKFLKNFKIETCLSEENVAIAKSITLINQEHDMNIQSILFVEDESMIRDVVSLYGVQSGHFIKSVPNAEAAKKIIQKKPNMFSIVLLDKHLPGEDGDEFGKKLKIFSPNIKVMIVTGDPDSVPKDIYQHGIDRIIQKPINFNIFKNTTGDIKKAA